MSAYSQIRLFFSNTDSGGAAGTVHLEAWEGDVTTGTKLGELVSVTIQPGGEYNSLQLMPGETVRVTIAHMNASEGTGKCSFHVVLFGRTP